MFYFQTTNLIKISARRVKNAIKRDKAELAQRLASVSILYKNAIKRDKAELAQRLASVSILFKHQIYLSISKAQPNLSNLSE